MNAKKDKSLLEKLREKKRIEMQNYRDKKKKEKLDNAIRTKSGKKIKQQKNGQRAKRHILRRRSSMKLKRKML